MSDPAETAKPGSVRKLHRLPDGAIPPDELAAIDDLLPVEATEAYLRWLEAGAEGPDPCGELSD